MVLRAMLYSTNFTRKTTVFCLRFQQDFVWWFVSLAIRGCGPKIFRAKSEFCEAAQKVGTRDWEFAVGRLLTFQAFVLTKGTRRADIVSSVSTSKLPRTRVDHIVSSLEESQRKRA